MDVPKDFFTIQSMLTLSGSMGTTFVVCNGLQRAFDFNPKWLGLAVAQIIVLMGVYTSGGQNGIDYAIGVINGFLVFCTAIGATSAIGTVSGSADTVVRGGSGAMHAAEPHPGKIRRSFLSPWF